MKYKAIDIMKTFSGKDIERCREFMNSKYLNKSIKVAKLYESLLLRHPDYDTSKFNEELLSKEVSPHLKYNRSSMKNLFADLSEALDQFLVLEEFSLRKFEISDILREAYFKRRLWKCFVKNYEKSEYDLDKGRQIITDFFFYKQKISTDKLNNLSLNKPKSGAAYSKEFNLIVDERAENITAFFTKELIRLHENLEALRRTFADDKGSFMNGIFEIIDFVRLTEFLQDRSCNRNTSKFFQIYNAMLICFSEFENEKHYDRYKNLIFSNMKLLTDDEMKFHLIRLIRYCMEKIEKANSADLFDVELLSVYKFILENSYYKHLTADFIPVELYRTIILQCLKLKEFDYASKIIKEYKNELPPDRRDNMHLYSTALYDFYTGKFMKALGNCQKVKLNHFVLKFELKNLMLMIYYELGLETEARSVIDSYRHFFSNNEIISKSEKRKQKAFIEVITKLFALREKKNVSEGFELRKLFESELPNKKWVEDKLVELNVLKLRSKNKSKNV
jgi:hypothetical protein